MVTIASSLQDTHAAAELAAGHDGIWSTAGVHPHEVSQAQDDDLNKIRDFAMIHPEVVAIGETGLDYYYNRDFVEQQQLSLRNHISVARELNKPLIIHTRDAREDTINLMRAHNAENCGVSMFSEPSRIGQPSRQ